VLFLNSPITQITVERKQDQQMSVTLVQLAYLPVCVEITKIVGRVKVHLHNST